MLKNLILLGILWIGSANCQDALAEAMGYAEPESMSYAEPEESMFMLQKRSLNSEEDSAANGEVEPEARRKKRDTTTEAQEDQDDHYLGDGHDHSEFKDDRRKRTVLTGLALYQLGKTLEKQAEYNGGTRGIPYHLLDEQDEVDNLRRRKRTITKDHKLLNWFLDNKWKKEESFRKYLVEGRYYYQPDFESGQFGSEDLEYLNYYSTTPTPHQLGTDVVLQSEDEHHHHDCHEHQETSEEELPPPPPPKDVQEPEDSYQVPKEDPEIPIPPPNESYVTPPSESYETPPPESYEIPPPESYVTPPPESYETPPPDSYVAPPPGSYQIPVNEDDNQSPIEVRPLLED
jgi:hypothetical protein